MFNLNFFKNIGVPLYLFIYLIIPYSAITKTLKVDFIRNLENSLNARDLEFIRKNFRNEESQNIPKQFSKIINDFPNSKWKIKRLKSNIPNEDILRIKVSGIEGIALTKLDVLDELDEIKMCVEYDLNGKKIDYLPAAVEDQLKIKPIYKTFDGWKTSTNGVKNINDLPENAKKYLFAIEDFIGAKISSISTSPERDDTILVENPFEI